MSLTAETMILSPPGSDQEVSTLEALSDRRTDIEAKQVRIASLLQELECDGLLALASENFAWLTSGASARGILALDAQPALYFSSDQRWIISSNADTQRLFDEELDGLGFQLKEWPWHLGREQLLLDLCYGRRIACDVPLQASKSAAEALRRMRLPLSPYEQACQLALGAIVSHALEATCRTMSLGDTEREVAGQLSHRLMHRGAQPMAIEVAADGRSRRYRQCGFTSQAVERFCVITVNARKYNLSATATRSLCFGEADPVFRSEHDAACKVSATYIASSWPDALPRQVLQAGKHVYQLTGFEHEWRLCPQGYVTGRLPVEFQITSQTESLLQSGWAVTWQANAGAAFSCDTFIVTDEGPLAVTQGASWPMKRIRIQGAEFLRPDILIR
jgi:Xaa-Pro dipeptidase